MKKLVLFIVMFLFVGNVYAKDITLDDVVNVINDGVITEEFKDISNNDMHIIEAIGITEPKNMSQVAKSLSVTVGTLTIAINNLVKKGYVDRVRSEKDRRVVYISLSDKGRKAFIHHAKFHKEMIQATINGLSTEEVNVLVKSLENLVGFFRDWQH